MMATVQPKGISSWLSLLFLLLVFGGDNCLVAFQGHFSKLRVHQIHYQPERRILKRYTLPQLPRDESLDSDEVSTGGVDDLPVISDHTSIDSFIQTKVSLSSSRRNTLQHLSQTALLTACCATFSSPLWNHPTMANAATSTFTGPATPLEPTAMSNIKKNDLNYVSSDTAKITHKVFFKVRISRPDGTFYVRDEEENEPENRVYYGQLTFGLFGVNAPNHVQRFLEYIVDPATSTPSTTPSSSSLSTTKNDETSYPSYSRSSFTQFDDATGVLCGGTIPSLEVVEIQQSVALRYGSRLLPAKLWIEPTTTPARIAHDRTGLLTHAQLDATPAFGITTRNDTSVLNPTHTVFGTFIMNADAKEFLHRIATIPTYSIDRPIVPPQSTTTTPAPATDAIYNLQRQFFRNTAKTLGDTRINKLYNGKLLRRVEVTQVGLL